MSSTYNANAPQVSTLVTVNSDLWAQAKDMNINISATLEYALIEVLRQKKTELWKTENRETIANYNETIKEQGLFSDGNRFF